MGRPRKENSLTPHDVIQAVLQCIDRDGEAALGVNRVARELGIKPPAIYKHLNGNSGLSRAVALEIWRDYLSDLKAQTAGITEPKALLRVGAMTTRHFAKTYPARYVVMMQYQMRPTDTEEAEIIQESFRLFQQSMQLYNLNEESLIDVMRMINSALFCFISREERELMTLNRSSDKSFEVMLEALIVAIDHIRALDST
ncbi:MAG: TetR-like C-terminal domain-containing protein [Chloroflexota bacterium]